MECQNGMAITSFHLPCDNQENSSLMRLPAELRLRVLRFLVVQGTPIEPWLKADEEATKKDEEGLNCHGCSGQILRCCQRLYWEAEPLLYKENTLVLHLAHDRTRTEHPVTCKTLSYELKIPDVPWDLSADSPEYRHLQDSQESFSIVLRCLLHRFDNLRLWIPTPVIRDSMQLLVVTYNFRQLVNGKHLTAKVNPEAVDKIAWFWVLKCFEFWRCKSIKFLTIYDNDEVLDDDDTERARQVIMSDQKIIDLMRPASDLAKLMARGGWLCPRLLDFRNSTLTNMDELWDAVFEQDEEEFRKQKCSLLVATIDIMLESGPPSCILDELDPSDPDYAKLLETETDDQRREAFTLLKAEFLHLTEDDESAKSLLKQNV